MFPPDSIFRKDICPEYKNYTPDCIVNSNNKNFLQFLEKVFYTINPAYDFMNSWNIQLMAEYLKDVEDGKIKRLIVNVPPRSLKSLCISVAWPAWILGIDPTKKIIVVSYSNSLSVKHSLDCRDVMQSDWYKDMFPNTIIPKGKNTQRKFYTTMHGFRYATSICGTLTGEGADIIILDDPQTPYQASNKKSQKKINDWYDQTLSSRLNNRKKGVIVLIMQRLHSMDLTHHLLGKKIFKQLKIPVISHKKNTYELNGLTYDFTIGETLNGFKEEDIEALKQELGSVAYNAQYMQEPINTDSQLFKSSWINRYESLPSSGYLVQSWDCAAKAGLNNDYSVCTTWKVYENSFYLVDVLRKKVSYVDLKHITIEHAQNYMPSAILIEDKASGQQLLEELRSIISQPVIGISPKQDKVTRAIIVSPLFEARKIYFPVSHHWLAEYEAELFSFPGSSHDDQVDSTTQFLSWVTKKDPNTSMKVL